MATCSILKAITIQEERVICDFIKALEMSMNKKTKEIHISKPVKRLNAEEAREMFVKGVVHGRRNKV